ncbi:ATP-binding protein [Rhodococcus sp. IEGM 1379]|uniref:ATP-binding protein n=1 Tax=Rhodococcus sp. IEGM 1379 TaxID=3047086 RepID=UPI0024B7E2FC|nr:ATP-binding protein [Rhodococcus sp. IEGM 1379]MDI9916602.1 ATP-binding protein [Rhodococcus sp. IEGM 1379]
MNLGGWWHRLGDRNTVTSWSWILTLPFAITLMTNYYLCTGFRDVALMSVGALLTHCVVGIMLLITRELLRARPSPWPALVAFAVIGATRPFVLDATTAGLDLPVDPRPMLVRVALNTVCSVVLLSLIGLLVGALRERIELQRSLLASRSALAMQQVRDRYRLDEVRLHCRHELERRIAAVMGTVAYTELEGAQGAALLRRISDEIVRPMSHRLFRETSRLAEAPRREARPTFVRMTARDRVAGVVRSVEAAPLYGPVVAYTVLTAIYLFVTYGVVFALVQIAVGFAILVLGNLAAVKVVRAESPLARIVSLTAAYGLGALTSSAVTYVLLAVFGYTPIFYLSVMVVYPLVALIICLIRAADLQRRDEEQQLRAALSEQAREASRIHGELNANRRRLAGLLHSSVQGELIVASWLSGDHSSVDVAGTLTRIFEEIENSVPGSTDRHGDSDARSRIDEVLAVWRYAIPIDSSVDDAVSALAPAGSVRLDAVVHVLSEGLTNAVKHGIGGPVGVEIGCSQTGSLVVQISSPGTLPAVGDSGIGLASIAAVVSSVTLVQRSRDVLLTAVLD